MNAILNVYTSVGETELYFSQGVSADWVRDTQRDSLRLLIFPVDLCQVSIMIIFLLLPDFHISPKLLCWMQDLSSQTSDVLKLSYKELVT